MDRVLCIGSASKDIFFPTDEGVIIETPEDLRSQTKVAFELGGKFLCRERVEAVGGVAANVAQGLAQMGHEAAVYSKIGADDTGEWILRTLRGAGVQTDTVDIDRAVSTDVSAIVVVQTTGDRIIFHNRDANEQLRLEESKLHSHEWFYISALNGAWKENLKLILNVAERSGVRIALNPGQHNLKEDPRLLLETLPHVAALFLNKDEALELLLAGGVESQPERLNDERYLIQTLHGFGPSVVALTDGKRGAWVYDGQEIWHGDIYEPHGLVDTTGAGDAFGSGFFSAYLYHYSIEKCLRYGMANAGSVVGSYGASTGLLDQTVAEDYGKHIHATLLAAR
ncbi:MAG: carbohydrate kinase family protein [Candidatus Moraniibacteriota bacterium]|nr:MAG: carbohydrate kinase family protein [Candidatus Moranbacteria bacterium]